MSKSLTDILWVARYDYNDQSKLEEHCHKYWQMLYILNGCGEFRIEHRKFVIQPGTVFLVKPNQLHSFVVSDCEIMKTYDIKFYLQEGDLQASLREKENIVVPRIEFLRKLFKKIQLEGDKKNPFYQELSNAYLFEMLVHIARQLNIESGTPESIKDRDFHIPQDPINQKITNYIREHYHDDLKLTVIAEALGYHQGYLSKVFKTEFDFTIMQYLYRYRVYCAKDLIAYSDFSLKEIATMVGFKSVHHFTRVFHELQGLTPGQYRDQEYGMVGKDIYLNDSFTNLS